MGGEIVQLLLARLLRVLGLIPGPHTAAGRHLQPITEDSRAPGIQNTHRHKVK